MSMRPTIRSAYLRRLGVAAEPPSSGALARLHRAHVERVPWETLWIHQGLGWGVGLDESVERIATTTRGGYCFHLNGAFGVLLGALGYDVSMHVGGVHGPAGPGPADMTNHLVLTVANLPGPANATGEWYVDVGLGDALHEPIPLEEGSAFQRPFDLSLEPFVSGFADWHLTHDPRGSFSGMVWSASPAGIDVFTHRHEFLSSSPDSHFVRTLIVQRRDATGADVLRGLTLQRVGENASVRTIESAAELVDALGDVFGVEPELADGAERDALWRRTLDAHVAWQAALEA